MEGIKQRKGDNVSRHLTSLQGDLCFPAIMSPVGKKNALFSFALGIETLMGDTQEIT